MGTRGRPRHPDVLTPAEWRVVDQVRHGMSNREIARRRGISVDAVKFHVANALLKLGLERRAELRTWRGVPADSALRTPRQGANMAVQLGVIGQISRSVGDIQTAYDELRGRGVEFENAPHLIHKHDDGVEEGDGVLPRPRRSPARDHGADA